MLVTVLAGTLALCLLLGLGWVVFVVAACSSHRDLLPSGVEEHVGACLLGLMILVSGLLGVTAIAALVAGAVMGLGRLVVGLFS